MASGSTPRRQRTRDELVEALRSINDAEAVRLERPLAARPGTLLSSGVMPDGGFGPVKLVFGIDEGLYFHWQLAILFESLVGQLPRGWEIIGVVCNDHREPPEALRHVFDTYGVRYVTAADHPSAVDIDFSSGGEHYAAFNKIEALRAIADRIDDGDRVCLIDTDNFLFGELDQSVFPAGNAVCANALIEQEPFQVHHGDAEIALRPVLQSLGLSGDFARGGVAVFLEGRTVRNEKFVHDCFRFSQILFLLGRAKGLESAWMAEMPCYAMSLAANGIEARVVPADAFVVDNRAEVAPGSFYHYYLDLADGTGEGAFHRSPWCKQGYRDRSLLDDDLERLEAAAVTEQERAFFRLAQRARDRLATR